MTPSKHGRCGEHGEPIASAETLKKICHPWPMTMTTMPALADLLCVCMDRVPNPVVIHPESLRMLPLPAGVPCSLSHAGAMARSATVLPIHPCPST